VSLKYDINGNLEFYSMIFLPVAAISRYPVNIRGTYIIMLPVLIVKVPQYVIMWKLSSNATRYKYSWLNLG